MEGYEWFGGILDLGWIFVRIFGGWLGIVQGVGFVKSRHVYLMLVPRIIKNESLTLMTGQI